MNKKSKILLILAVVVLAILVCFVALRGADRVDTPDSSAQGSLTLLPDTTEAAQDTRQKQSTETQAAAIDESGTYSSKEDVALYILTYGKLPQNFITKNEARALGWEGGSLEPYAPGKCIGGDRFGNYEGLLPEAEGRTYTECDIDTLGASSRGAKRIVFSNDGLIYYTDDHYESFTLIYGGDEP
ncbi:MAG: ribonuclease [Oscillospiraceae bacterium]|nr:ribonuclease [Oscillospiraceae bacterium]